MEIESWNKLFKKSVKIENDLTLVNSTITVGNQNSYSDCNIPLSNSVIYQASSNEFADLQKKNQAIFNPLISVSEYISNTNEFLFGIPGSPRISLGGAIAADTHGKDGYLGKNFGSNVETLYLKIASGEVLKLDNKNNPDILWSTIGGFGLTGQIVGIEMKQDKLPYSKFFNTELKINKGIDKLIDCILNHDDRYFLAVVDLVNKGFRWITKISETTSKEVNLYNVKNYKEIKVPLGFIGNNFLYTKNLLNLFYPYMQKDGINHFSNFFFTQGGIRDPRNFCKNQKIVEVQFSLPMNEIKNLGDILTMAKKYFKPIACSVKILGFDLNKNNLSFYQRGIAVNFDFPLSDFNFDKLNEIYIKIIKYNGKINLAKDSFLTPSLFLKMYPEHSSWLKTVKKIDPDKKFQSKMSKRLHIK